jgi:hypothetical protein
MLGLISLDFVGESHSELIYFCATEEDENAEAFRTNRMFVTR